MHFNIQSSENLPIRANLEVPRGARALAILVHGFKGFKDWGFFPWLAEVLWNERIAVCRFNMSRNGIGENLETFDRLDLFADDTYSLQLDDLQRVVRHCDETIALPTFLVGHSRGGGVAILSAAKILNLRGVVTWSSISHVDRWDEPTLRQWRKDGHMDGTSTRMLDDIERHRFDIIGTASRLQVPLLVVHGARDESVPVSESKEIAAAAPDVSRLIIRNASHTYNAIHPLVHIPFELMLAADVTSRFIRAYS